MGDALANPKSHRGADEHGWTEVRIKKPPVKGPSQNHITSFYVSNFHSLISVHDSRNIFLKFGSITDVHYSNMKDSSGSTFAFVRYKGAKDSKEFEKILDRIKCRDAMLKVNVAR
ncbi:unnamed protein product [Lactuca saligna]|uniref:RRM domain-containing protein n=1 Tax=Lactuca saligna TaxID=75948 RepID=A0AA35ZT70_LACSI|nr:unnamed protein product [Lactuca saligna]